MNFAGILLTGFVALPFATSAAQVPRDKPANPQPEKSRWVTDSEISRMDDTRSYKLTLQADDQLIGSVRSTPEAVIFCTRGGSKPTLAFQMGQTLDAHQDVSGDVNIQLRLDKDPPRNEKWFVSQDFGTIFTLKDDAERVAELARYQTLLLQVPLYPSGLGDVQFTLAGLAQQLSWLKQQCGI